jgi:hypothetical protein
MKKITLKKKSKNILTGSLTLFDQTHTVTALRVEDDEELGQIGAGDATLYDDIWGLAGSGKKRLRTVKIPGHEGQWIIAVYPECQ